MKEKVSHHFWWDMAVASCVGGHDMSKDVGRNTDRLSLGCIKVQAMKQKAEKNLCISRRNTGLLLIGPRTPLKKIPFGLEVLTFDMILPRFERVPEAEIYSKQIRKGQINGKDPKGIQQRIQRGSGTTGTNIRQADCTNCSRTGDL